MNTRIPITCISCHKSLSGELDTYGDVGSEMCWNCWSSFMEPEQSANVEIVEDEDLDVQDIDDDELEANGGLIEARGNWFCFACGMLAQPGDEEFDWCDHISGVGCAYYVEGMDDFDSEWEGWDE